ncbi:uncharacterized protein J3R85_007645 [Psidium guajava]|nr:uncharacterized protein J3R85_007645 [Psidium guajava]
MWNVGMPMFTQTRPIRATSSDERQPPDTAKLLDPLADSGAAERRLLPLPRPTLRQALDDADDGERVPARRPAEEPLPVHPPHDPVLPVARPARRPHEGRAEGKARREFEAARLENDPEVVGRLLDGAGVAVHAALEEVAQGRGRRSRRSSRRRRSSQAADGEASCRWTVIAGLLINDECCAIMNSQVSLSFSFLFFLPFSRHMNKVIKYRAVFLIERHDLVMWSENMLGEKRAAKDRRKRLSVLEFTDELLNWIASDSISGCDRRIVGKIRAWRRSIFRSENGIGVSGAEVVRFLSPIAAGLRREEARVSSCFEDGEGFQVRPVARQEIHVHARSRDAPRAVHRPPLAPGARHCVPADRRRRFSDERLELFQAQTFESGDGLGQRGEQWTEVLSWEPRAFIYHGFLSKEECEYLINLAKPHMVKSTVVDSATGKSKDSRVRTSSGTFLQRGQDKVIKDIEKRIADFTFIPVEHGEGLQILHYEVGQKYDAHYDYFLDEFNTKNGGQRLLRY